MVCVCGSDSWQYMVSKGVLEPAFSFCRFSLFVVYTKIKFCSDNYVGEQQTLIISSGELVCKSGIACLSSLYSH